MSAFSKLKMRLLRRSMNSSNRGFRFRFGAGTDTALALEGLLARHGIHVHQGSVLERMSLSAFNVGYRSRSLSNLDGGDIRPGFADLIAITELGSLLLNVQNHPSFPRLVPHLRLLNEGALGQNQRADRRDQAANKIFELFTACLAMQISTNVEVEAPKGSGKDQNPDVMAEIGGVTWGIACKVLHSKHPEAIIGNLTKAIDQIERSSATKGIVFFSLKNLIDHEKYWLVSNPEEWKEGAEPLFSAYPDHEVPIRMLQQKVGQLLKPIVDQAGLSVIAGLFSGKKAIPGILNHVHTVVGLVVDDRPTPSSLRFLSFHDVATVDPADQSVLTGLHRAATQWNGIVGA